ncbi:MAG: glycosyltransferase family 4 protein [Scytonematopsis contorta HA4267-MV1]|jgi:glycosyltransferase involved in cell wall biosynthesis|nr:glycosyltransferase family 4 protein [Scytonematopsis contorta HA4267-MV1]
MRILQMNLSDYALTGGTGIAMHRLHNALNKVGVASKIYCSRKELGTSDTVMQKRSYQVRVLEGLLRRLEIQVGLNDVCRVISSLNIQKTPFYQEADVINLHCIHDEFISYLTLPWLSKKPTVFYLHDMWSFTGHCHYSYECERWKTGCGKCPHLEIPGAVKTDNSHLEWKLKNWIYSHSNLNIVTPSKWMYSLAKESMLQRFPIHHIPYGVDTEVYRLRDKQDCRKVLGIPQNKKVLMFNSLSMKDHRKGGDLLLKALEELPQTLKSEIVLLTIGGGEGLPKDNGLQTVNFGFVNSDDFKAILYSAADLFICPTRADNSPLVLYESIACGTPIIGFNTGGLPDLIRPGVTGLLAKPENVDDLRNHIVHLLSDETLRNSMKSQCREIAVNEYSLELYAQRFSHLYRNSLN